MVRNRDQSSSSQGSLGGLDRTRSSAVADSANSWDVEAGRGWPALAGVTSRGESSFADTKTSGSTLQDYQLHGIAMRCAAERRNLAESIAELRQIADGTEGHAL
jgi:hypothetical protein